MFNVHKNILYFGFLFSIRYLYLSHVKACYPYTEQLRMATLAYDLIKIIP
jgi:hypothetical protein